LSAVKQGVKGAKDFLIFLSFLCKLLSMSDFDIQPGHLPAEKIIGAVTTNGTDAYWTVSADGALGIRLGKGDAHRISWIPKAKILAWTNDDNDALDAFAASGLDFHENKNGARKLIRDYMMRIGDLSYAKIDANKPQEPKTISTTFRDTTRGTPKFGGQRRIQKPFGKKGVATESLPDKP
jgi:hypothetical protein